MAGYPITRRRNVALLSVAALLGLATPAQAALAGTCAIKVQIAYGIIGPVSTTGSIDVSSVDIGNSACAGTSAPGGVPPALMTTVNFHDTGTPNATEKSCQRTTATGAYHINFVTDGTFVDSDGTFTFNGNVAGGVMVLEGTLGPTFDGEVNLVLDPLTTGNVDEVIECAYTDDTTLVYRGTLTFVES